VTLSPAYDAIRERATANGGRIAAADAAILIARHDPECEAAFRRISAELDAGLGHDHETIAERVRLPAEFVLAFLRALRAPGATTVVTVQ
jgi:hypothetical protein